MSASSSRAMTLSPCCFAASGYCSEDDPSPRLVVALLRQRTTTSITRESRYTHAHIASGDEGLDKMWFDHLRHVHSELLFLHHAHGAHPEMDGGFKVPANTFAVAFQKETWSVINKTAAGRLQGLTTASATIRSVLKWKRTISVITICKWGYPKSDDKNIQRWKLEIH